MPKLDSLKKIKHLHYYFLLGVVLLLTIIAVSGTNSSQRTSYQQPQAPANASSDGQNIQPDQGRVLQATTQDRSVGYNFTVANLNALASALANMMSAGSPAVVTNAQTQQQEVVYQGGALTSLLNVTGTMYQSPPASTEVWANDIRQRANIGVYAQDANQSNTYNPGQGFELLEPIQSLWRSAVELVYVIYILIVVFLAFLILFRSQLGGQETITLYNAIPSLAISLFLVYFSYPISALFIDVITIGSGAVYGALVGDGPNSGAPGAYLYGQAPQSSTAVNNAITNLAGLNDGIDPENELQIDDRQVNLWYIFYSANVTPTGEEIGDIVPQDVPLANILGAAIDAFTGGGLLVDNLLSLVFAFAAFSAGLQLFFKLMKAYVYLIVLPILSPFIFLLAALPNQRNQIIGSYFGQLLASALSFVAVYAVFLVIIIVGRDTTDPDNVLWVPPLMGYSSDQSLPGGSVANIARPLIAYSLFISTPLIPDTIYRLFQINQDNQFTQNIIDTTKGGARTLTGVAATGVGLFRGATDTTPDERR